MYCFNYFRQNSFKIPQTQASLNRNDITLEISRYHDEKERITQEKSNQLSTDDAEELRAILERARQYVFSITL